MALTPKLEIKQSQSLQLTPQLRQAISLLQMSNLELNDVIEQELRNNPLLEREDDYLNENTETTPPSIDTLNDKPENPYQESPIAPENDEQDAFDDFGSDTEGYTSFETTEWSDYNHSKIQRTNDDSFDYFEQKLSKEKSLYDILDEQIGAKWTNPADKLIAKILNEQLDEAGYFRGDTASLAAKLKTSPERLQKILNGLKTFEPSGIFAENLSECLKIQAADAGLLSKEMACLLDNLPLLAERRFKELAKLCGCSVENIPILAARIKQFNPKPTAAWFADKPAYVIPDVFVRRTASGKYRVELNNLSLPKLLINHTYYSNFKKDKTAARYLKENLSHASFLIRAMHQRATTILRVSEEIILRQYDFFEKGIEYLKPMTLKDLAETLELNESTVSRVTTNKYMSTPNGLFELKYFFSAAAGSYIGKDDTSTTVIKHKIKTLIENETPAHILSDDNIVTLLENEGIKIARRTVAKYRESLGIKTSAERKRLKRK